MPHGLPIPALLLAFLPLCASAQEIRFDMSVFGIRFGTMLVTRSAENDSTELYTLIAKGKTDFLWMKREEETRYQVRYRNGLLHSSDYTYLNKGKVEKWARVKRAGSQCRIETHEGTRTLKEVPDYSILKLYFEPDWQRTRIFCEEDCAFSAMQPDHASGILRITCTNGNRSTYRLRDGRVQELEVHLAVATVKILRVD